MNYNTTEFAVNAIMFLMSRRKYKSMQVGRLRAVLLFPSDHARKATAKLCWSRLRRSLDPSRVGGCLARYTKALFIWSRVPETTLPPSYPGRANFSLISLKNSTDCLHENANSSRGGETTRVGELSRLGR